MAPEVLRCPPKNLPQENKNNASLHYNNSVDAWAVGVFAYELIVGYPPFAGESQLASVDKIIHATPEFPDKMSELAKSFIVAVGEGAVDNVGGGGDEATALCGRGRRLLFVGGGDGREGRDTRVLAAFLCANDGQGNVCCSAPTMSPPPLTPPPPPPPLRR